MSKTGKPREPTWEESRAAEVVRTTLGASVTPLDVPPQQNCADYTVHDADPPSVLEVTQHVDGDRMKLHVTMGQRDYEFPRSDLKRFWSLHLPPMESEYHRRYSQVVADLDTIAAILGALESIDQLSFGPSFWSERPNHEVSMLRRLGVESGQALSSGGPAIYFLPPGDGGASGTAVVVAAALEEASKTDNRTKLEKGTGNGGATDRHLFVWISGTQALPYYAMLDRELPTTGPELPPWVSQLWIGARYRTEQVVWRWDGSRWSDVFTPPARSTAVDVDVES
ncbi:MAG: hypothetical protein WA966_14825 [Ornithinimicrobium sp.]